MRLKIELQCLEGNIALPINYQYPLSAAIYKVFESASPEFAEFLHSVGFMMRNGKPTKFFCFSKLFFKIFNLDTGKGELRASPEAHLYFSTPLDETLAVKFVDGIMRIDGIYIGNSKVGRRFRIASVETMRPPQFTGDDRFEFISPVSLSKQVDNGNIRRIHYILPGNDDFFTAMETNLRGKYEYLHERPFSGELKILPQNDVKPPVYKSKLITIKEGTPEETKVKAFYLPIRIIGEMDILQTAYECGLGERNSLGFGMIELSEIKK